MVGDIVRIKSREWYEKNKNINGDVVFNNRLIFMKVMVKHCGKEAKIVFISEKNGSYRLNVDNGYCSWYNYMFEGEDKVIPIKKEVIMVSKNYKLSDKISGFEELESIAEEHGCVAWKCGLITSYQLKPASFFLNWNYMMLKNQLPRLYKVEKVNEN